MDPRLRCWKQKRFTISSRSEPPFPAGAFAAAHRAPGSRGCSRLEDWNVAPLETLQNLQRGVLGGGAGVSRGHGFSNYPNQVQVTGQLVAPPLPSPTMHCCLRLTSVGSA